MRWFDFCGTPSAFIARVTMVSCLLIMLWAVATLGFKCSNLMNRGIVTGGPYRFIRHPHYAFKLAHWWITLLPVFISVPLAPVFMAGWTSIYFLRAITEERHLRSDPDCVAYCEKVKSGSFQVSTSALARHGVCIYAGFVLETSHDTPPNVCATRGLRCDASSIGQPPPCQEGARHDRRQQDGDPQRRER